MNKEKLIEILLDGRTEEEISTLGRNFLSTAFPRIPRPGNRHIFAIGLMLLGIPIRELLPDESLKDYEKEEGFDVRYTRILEQPSGIIFRFKNYTIVRHPWLPCAGTGKVKV